MRVPISSSSRSRYRRASVGRSVHATCGGRASLPSRHPFVARSDLIEHGDVARKFGVHVAVVLVAGADRDAIERVEHVELRHRDVGQSVDPRRVAHHDGVEPAAAARAARRRAELVAEGTDALAHRLVHLGRQRSRADARGVRLHHAEHGVDRRRRDPGPDRRAARCRAARCHERIRAVVDVEQRTLRALEQHRRAGLLGAMHHQADVLRQRQQAVAQAGRVRRASARYPRALRFQSRRAARSPARRHARRGRPIWRGFGGRARGRRGARPCPRTPDRCRVRWCQATANERSRRRSACDREGRDGRDR